MFRRYQNYAWNQAKWLDHHIFVLWIVRVICTLAAIFNVISGIALMAWAFESGYDMGPRAVAFFLICNAVAAVFPREGWLYAGVGWMFLAFRGLVAVGLALMGEKSLTLALGLTALTLGPLVFYVWIVDALGVPNWRRMLSSIVKYRPENIGPATQRHRSGQSESTDLMP